MEKLMITPQVSVILCILTVLLIFLFRCSIIFVINEHYRNKFIFNHYLLIFEPCKKLKYFKLNIMFKIDDIVTWKNPFNHCELNDKMVILDLTPAYAMVKHADGAVSMEKLDNLKFYSRKLF